MGTKLNPGTYDCYANAEPDEPMFVLLARDPLAPFSVEQWADRVASQNAHLPKEARIRSDAKVAEARDCAAAMREWKKNHQK